jgi:ubiquinone/menaquinone biosynthesis C-methylase UbiE
MSERLSTQASERQFHDAFQDEQIHDLWESHYRNNRNQDRFNDIIMDRILRCLNLRPGANVLDAGCGGGAHTVRFAKRGFYCTGVDISRPMLERAKELAAAEGVAPRVSYVCCGLEDLSRLDTRFDAVHCRGVLMHIPRWQDVLGELCRVLLPGGKIVILEGNHRSLELAIVRVVRFLRKSEARLVASPAGVEFHRAKQGHAPLTRVANVPHLIAELQSHRIRSLYRFATEFWDIGRFPAGILRNSAILFNRAWFTLRLPALFSSGNAVIAEKREQ